MKGIYRHKKGNIYRVLFEAKHSETLEDLVIYQDVNDETKIWARPKSMFLDKGRFTKIDENTKIGISVIKLVAIVNKFYLPRSYGDDCEY